MTRRALSARRERRRLARRLRAEIAPLSILFVGALCVLGFIGLADMIQGRDAPGFDRRILEMLRPWPDDPARPWGPWWLHEAAADVTALGGMAVLGLFALSGAGFLLIRGKRLAALLLACGLLGGTLLSEGLKALFDRARPPLEIRAVETLNASFPSGHALQATVVFLTLGVMLARVMPRRRLKVYVMSVAVVLAALVGMTRVYLGAHWPSDVLAGWCVVAAWAVALWIVAHVVERAADRTADHGPADVA